MKTFQAIYWLCVTLLILTLFQLPKLFHGRQAIYVRLEMFLGTDHTFLKLNDIFDMGSWKTIIYINFNWRNFDNRHNIEFKMSSNFFTVQNIPFFNTILITLTYMYLCSTIFESNFNFNLIDFNIYTVR